MLIRRYEAADRDAARQVEDRAFRTTDAVPPEVKVFDDLLDAGDDVPELSFVALRDGEIVGHVMCSHATVGDHEVVALGPIGVLPEHQRDGVGSALVNAVLAAAETAGEPLVALLGSTEWYPRFGFVPSTSIGIEPQEAAWGDDFQVRTLPAYDPAITGLFHYAPAFDAV